MKKILYAVAAIAISANVAFADSAKQFGLSVTGGTLKMPVAVGTKDMTLKFKTGSSDAGIAAHYRLSNCPVIFKFGYNIGSNINVKVSAVDIVKRHTSLKFGAAYVFDNLLTDKHSLSVGLNVGSQRDIVNVTMDKRNQTEAAKMMKLLSPSKAHLEAVDVNVAISRPFAELELVNSFDIINNISLIQGIKLGHQFGAKHVLIPYKYLGIYTGLSYQF